MTKAPFQNHREAALAVLCSGIRLSRNAGRFLGQLVADPAPMSAAQAEWFAKLLEKAGLPPLAGEGAP